MNDRTRTLLSLFDPTGQGLEIGPSYNPLVPKAAGYRVETVDYASQEDLVAKYLRDGNADTSRIEHVDFVTRGRPILKVIPHRDYYDYVVASHVIEHTPDLIDFLVSCSALLRDSGTLVLAVPDKRFCFDLLQPLSSTGAIIQAHLDGRKRPSPGAVFDSIAYDVLRDGKIGWSVDTDSEISFNADLKSAQTLMGIARQSPDYIDVHVWRFVPSSFRMIVEDLYQIGFSSLREMSYIRCVGHEFFIALSKSGSGPDLGRIELAVAAMRELHEAKLPG